MKGRPPKTLEQRAADGDTRKLGRKKHAEAIDASIPVELGFPPCPAHLKGEARRMWEFWAPRLAEAKIDYAVSAPALENACLQQETIVAATRAIQREGLFVREKAIVDGKPVVLRIRKHPAEQVRARASMLLKTFMIEFGMTPVSRARVSNGEAGKGSPSRKTEEALRQLNASINKPRKLNFVAVQ